VVARWRLRNPITSHQQPTWPVIFFSSNSHLAASGIHERRLPVHIQSRCAAPQAGMYLRSDARTRFDGDTQLTGERAPPPPPPQKKTSARQAYPDPCPVTKPTEETRNGSPIAKRLDHFRLWPAALSAGCRLYGMPNQISLKHAHTYIPRSFERGLESTR